MGEILYQGHGSIRITTGEGCVIYIDPFQGEGYDKPADLILITHQHPDHNMTDKPAKKEGSVFWSHQDFIVRGQYAMKRFGNIVIRAVEAYNHCHSREEGVGYLISFDGVKVYIAGDTAKTKMMERLSAENINYAFLPIDGKYTMDAKEAAECADIIQAKCVIPYHMSPGSLFDQEKAEAFCAGNRRILRDGESICTDEEAF